MWNDLPVKTKQASSLAVFKKFVYIFHVFLFSFPILGFFYVIRFLAFSLTILDLIYLLYYSF